MKQNSKYRLDCRFNKEKLKKKIERIIPYKEKIVLFHRDGLDFINNILSQYKHNDLFIFFDPPYVSQGGTLYKNKLTYEYHEQLAQAIQQIDWAKWITTYDYKSNIEDIYKKSQRFKYKIQYSAYKKSREFEYLFANPAMHVESYENVMLQYLY